MKQNLFKALDEYVDKKMVFEFASREPGSDGYCSACVEERKAMERAKEKVEELLEV